MMYIFVTQRLEGLSVELCIGLIIIEAKRSSLQGEGVEDKNKRSYNC